MEDRVVELETRVAFQEDSITKLEARLVAQEHLVYKLSGELEQIRSHLRAAEPAQVLSAKDEPPPPHY